MFDTKNQRGSKMSKTLLAKKSTTQPTHQKL